MAAELVNMNKGGKTFTEVFVLLLGIMCGCFYGWLNRNEENLGIGITFESTSFDVAQSQTVNETVEFLLADDTSIADELARSINVLCWMHTKSIDMKRFDAINRTWGARCTEFIAISESGQNASNIFVIPNSRPYERVIDFIYVTFGERFDWHFRTDGDDYVVLENLRFHFYPYDPNEPIAMGLTKTDQQQTYLSEKSGFALSRGAVKILANGFKKGLECTKIKSHEIQLGACLSEVGAVFAKDTDAEGKQLFFEKNLDTFFLPVLEAKLPYPWYQDYKVDHNLNLASNFSISFSEYRSEEMFVLEFIIYQWRPYGWETIMPKLPNKISLV